MDGVEDLVLAACLEDQCFDRQCEGSRADWMYSLFKGTPAYPRFVGPILAALANSTDDRDGDQLRELASLMGRNGDLKAASALRSFVWAQTFSADSVLGAAALCALDGIPAVIEMAQHLGKVVLQDPDAWVDTVDRLIDHTISFDTVFAELKRVAAGDEAVAAYVAREGARIASDAAHDRSHESQAERDERRGEEFMARNPCDAILAAATRKSAGRGLFLLFGRWAGEEDLIRILDHLRVEPDPKVSEKLLWIFRRATLPYLDEHVWELASHSATDVRNAAVMALSNLSDPRVYALGRERLGDPDFSSEFSEEIALFKNSFQPGDETLILDALERQSVDGDEAHALGSSAVDLCTSATPASAGRGGAMGLSHQPVQRLPPSGRRTAVGNGTACPPTSRPSAATTHRKSCARWSAQLLDARSLKEAAPWQVPLCRASQPCARRRQNEAADAQHDRTIVGPPGGSRYEQTIKGAGEHHLQAPAPAPHNEHHCADIHVDASDHRGHQKEA
ncbi:hypothetical protein [Massilia rubra]|uniref:HEAT repeat domain-containing protein n=1 Tax=Massilia rubra TaxID=2607910 RepID=A0ABX0LMN2_9BURK|nr:hypothetical protein [Massilia rubra]NHZ34060.1 hypothetical protein [Massilia rubra]